MNVRRILRGVSLPWIFALSLVLVLTCDLAQAQSTSAVPAAVRYDLRIWQTDEGLPQNSVNAITQTSDGYLWVGTRQGLVRFDGVRFRPVDDLSMPHLRNAPITALQVCRDGSLWIACESNGVTRLQEGQFTQYLKNDGLPDNQIQCMLETSDGAIWFGGTNGLARFYDGKFISLQADETLTNNSVKALAEDRNGILRIATVTGLFSVDLEGKGSTNNFGLGAVPGVFKAVQVDRTGRLWLGAVNGLTCFENGERRLFSSSASMVDRITTVIHEDREGQLWVGTYEGLDRRINGIVTPWWVGKRGISDLVNVVFEDREQTLWVGGRDGLYRLSPARFVTLTAHDGLSGNNVVAVLEDQTGFMWFSCWGSGVNAFQNGSFTRICTTNGLTQDDVLALAAANDGGLFVGMDKTGIINHFKLGSSNDRPRFGTPVAAGVRVIHQEPDDTLWIGTMGGLSRVQGGEVTVFNTTNGLSGNDVISILAHNRSNIWFGTESGISLWTGESFTNLPALADLSSVNVSALHEDQDGGLWIGTRGAGLNRFAGGKLRSYTTSQGLFSDEIYEILEDELGFLWMTCGRGLFRVNRQQFEALDHGQIQQVNCTIYGREDGLETVQFSGVAKPAGWKSRDGRLWFATIRGVLMVEPRIRINEAVPPVAIEEVIVDQRSLWQNTVTGPMRQLVRIPPGNGRIEIRFTTLSLRAAEKNHFKYRLEKVEPEWVDNETQRLATFNNILPGTYRFEVKASNNDGIWNETPATIFIRIEPHFWQTWWFRAALIAAPVGLAFWLYRVRVHRLRELEILRIRIATDLHDDVGSRLTKVAMVTELADRETPDTEPAKAHIRNISRTVRDITRAMDEIVWTINPRNDTLDNLANYIFHFAQEYFQDTGVRCRLDLPAVLPEQKLATEVRHNLFMAVKEALNNVLKHSAATEVRISLSLTESALRVTIRDNGHGVPASKGDPTGIGIDTMRQRLEQIGGYFGWKSNSGGTTVVFTVPDLGNR